MAKNISYANNEYCVGTIPALEALELFRLSAPILPVLFHEVLSEVAIELLKETQDQSVEKLIESVGTMAFICKPILDEVANMPKDRWDRMTALCLTHTERKHMGSYQKVMRDGFLAFDDIDAVGLILLVITSLIENLKPFISALGAFGASTVLDSQERRSSS